MTAANRTVRARLFTFPVDDGLDASEMIDGWNCCSLSRLSRWFARSVVTMSSCCPVLLSSDWMIV